LSAHLHHFSRLEIGGAIVRDPEIIVADVRLSDADLVLGIDFLDLGGSGSPMDRSRSSCRAGLSNLQETTAVLGSPPCTTAAL
jgi:hypothetical protein